MNHQKALASPSWIATLGLIIIDRYCNHHPAMQAFTQHMQSPHAINQSIPRPSQVTGFPSDRPTNCYMTALSSRQGQSTHEHVTVSSHDAQSVTCSADGML